MKRRNGLPLKVLALLAMMAGLGCEPRSSSPATAPMTATTTTAPKPPGEPVVRVRIARAVTELHITGPSQVQIAVADHPETKQLLSTPVTLRRVGGQWIGPWNGGAMPVNATLELRPLGPAGVRIDKTTYPGFCRIVPNTTPVVAAAPPAPTVVADDEAADDAPDLSPAVLGAKGSPKNSSPKPAAARPAPPPPPSTDQVFDVINHSRLEAYLPGVLQGELYDSWDAGAFLSQAIAARSYAIDRMMTFGPGNYFDVEAGQASQAYIGGATNPVAIRAVADTAGLVLTWNGHIIPAYYSSTCGGAAVSPRDAFNVAQVIAPLEPRGTRTCCVSAPYFNWGPIEQNTDKLSRRIAAWGYNNKMSVARVGRLIGARVSKITAAGRPVEFEVTDGKQVFALRGEQFRAACNYSNDVMKIEGPTAKQKLKSSYFNISVSGDRVLITDGHGFGHGVGMCQYGMQAMAHAGKHPLEILAFYYPGAKVERAY
jgi:SpoIID/LytB domain protein